MYLRSQGRLRIENIFQSGLQDSYSHRALTGGLYAVATPFLVSLVCNRVVRAYGNYVPEGPVLL